MLATTGMVITIAIFQLIWLIPGVDYNANKMDKINSEVLMFAPTAREMICGIKG